LGIDLKNMFMMFSQQRRKIVLIIFKVKNKCESEMILCVDKTQLCSVIDNKTFSKLCTLQLLSSGICTNVLNWMGVLPLSISRRIGALGYNGESIAVMFSRKTLTHGIVDSITTAWFNGTVSWFVNGRNMKLLHMFAPLTF
jgi:hypothetical protein